MSLPNAFGGGGMAGMLAIHTASFFRLDPTLSVPIEPIADIVPGTTPYRQTLDMIDRDEMNRTWRVTQRPIQNAVNVTPHRQRQLKVFSISGVITNAPMPLTPAQPPRPFVRTDQLRLSFLERIAETEEPIMVCTPRGSLPLAWITVLRTPWQPSDGRSTPVQIVVQECRIARPFTTGATKDLDSLEAGNTTAESMGEQTGTTVEGTVTEAPVTQAAPTFGAAGATL